MKIFKKIKDLLLKYLPIIYAIFLKWKLRKLNSDLDKIDSSLENLENMKKDEKKIIKRYNDIKEDMKKKNKKDKKKNRKKSTLDQANDLFSKNKMYWIVIGLGIMLSLYSSGCVTSSKTNEIYDKIDNMEITIHDEIFTPDKPELPYIVWDDCGEETCYACLSENELQKLIIWVREVEDYIKLFQEYHNATVDVYETRIKYIKENCK